MFIFVGDVFDPHRTPPYPTLCVPEVIFRSDASNIDAKVVGKRDLVSLLDFLNGDLSCFSSSWYVSGGVPPVRNYLARFGHAGELTRSRRALRKDVLP